MKANLHMHSIHSDGHLPVFKLVERLEKLNFDYMALTDHDTIDGLKELKEATKDTKIKPVFGLELSTVRNNESIHVLGYFKEDSSFEAIESYLNMQKLKREERAKKMCDNLAKYFNINIDYEELFKYAKGVIARPHIAEMIIKNGYNYTWDEIFDKIISEDSPVYVPSTKISYDEGVELLKNSGLIAVLAHPGLYHKNRIEDLIKSGIDGIECIYPAHKDEEMEKYIKLAKENHLLITSGSDFHFDGDLRHGSLDEIRYVDFYNEYIKKFLNKLKERMSYE